MITIWISSLDAFLLFSSNFSDLKQSAGLHRVERAAAAFDQALCTGSDRTPMLGDCTEHFLG